MRKTWSGRERPTTLREAARSDDPSTLHGTHQIRQSQGQELLPLWHSLRRAAPVSRRETTEPGLAGFELVAVLGSKVLADGLSSDWMDFWRRMGLSELWTIDSM